MSVPRVDPVAIPDRPLVDEELRSFIPPLAESERAQLEENIMRDGCREPLSVWKSHGILLDGHHRLEICERRGVIYGIAEIDLPDRDAVKLWMVQNQVGRRDMTAAARIATVRQVRPQVEAQARARMLSGVADPTQKSAGGETRDALATMAGVSHDTFTKCEYVLDHGDESTKAGMLSGSVSIHQAYTDTEHEIRKQERLFELEEAEDAQRRADEAARSFTVKPGEWWKLGRHVLYCGDTSSADFRDSCPSAALAFADPPYGAGAAEWDDVFVWGHDWLSERASVTAVTPGIVSIFDFARLTAMPYQWSAACWIDNGMTRGALGFGNWVYVALFSAGSLHRNAQDFVKVSISNADTEESNHKGRKPTAFLVWLLQTFTKKGDMVIDPFAGSGTTLIVCESTGRTCVTGEIDPEFCREIILRWQGVTGEVATRG